MVIFHCYVSSPEGNFSWVVGPSIPKPRSQDTNTCPAPGPIAERCDTSHLTILLRCQRWCLWHEYGIGTCRYSMEQSLARACVFVCLRRGAWNADKGFGHRETHDTINQNLRTNLFKWNLNNLCQKVEAMSSESSVNREHPSHHER